MTITIDLVWLADPMTRRIIAAIAFLLAGYAISWRGWNYLFFVLFLIAGVVAIP